MISFNILEETPNQINSLSYLSAFQSASVSLSSSTELFFGDDENSKIYFGLFDTNEENITFNVLTGSFNKQLIQYIYKDIDGNSFLDQFSYYKNNFIQDTEKNVLFDLSTAIDNVGSISSDVFYVLVSPVIELFSVDSPLTIKAVSNSRTEIQLSPNFTQENVTDTISLSFNGQQIFLSGSIEITLSKGIVYTINVANNFDQVAFSQTTDGALYAGGIAYTKNIIFKSSAGQIVIDASDDSFPSTLYVYNNMYTNCGVKINFLDVIDPDTLKSNVEFLGLDSDKFLYKRIYSLMSSYLSSFNTIDAIDTAMMENTDKLNSLYLFLNIKTPTQLSNLVNILYYGESYYDTKRKKQVSFTGIQEYILDFMKFNYEFLGDSTSFLNQINAINVYVVDSWLTLTNINANSSSTPLYMQYYSDSLTFLTNLFNNFLLLSQLFVKSDYISKFQSPLKNALHFDNENIAPILISYIDYTDPNNLIYVVKLQNPLDSTYDVGTTCNVINISIEPIFQKVNFSQAVATQSIRLAPPNFSIVTEDETSVSKPTPYYTSTQLSASSDINNSISISQNTKKFNIDYTDFSNFVVFSSAYLRVKIFENKIIKLALLGQNLINLSNGGQTPGTFTQADGFNNTIVLDVYSDAVTQQNNIISSFDFYESYLYMQYLNDNFAYDINTKQFVESEDVGLPNPQPSNYISNLEINASQYDKSNRDSLINNTPEFISTNTDNDEYLKFLGMIGHHFDNIYIYVSNFYLYKETGNTVDDGLNRGLLSSILNSFGFNIPPSLSGNIDESDVAIAYLSNISSPSFSGSYAISLDDKTKTIWKRILSNLPIIYKSKGTQESIRYILSCYGIPRNFIQIKEFGGGYNKPNISAWNEVAEDIYLLEFIGNNNEYVNIQGLQFCPYSSVDFKFWIDTDNYSDNTLVQLFSKYDGNGNQVFSLGFIKESDTLGSIYVILIQGTNTFSYTTEFFNLFTNDITGILFRQNSINSKFEETLDPSVIPTQYDICVCKRSDELNTDSYEYSFYLSSSFNDIFDINNYNIFGNIESSLQPGGQFFNISSIIPGYSISNFIGVMDRFSYDTSPISDDVFFTKSKNIYSYYDGLPSSSSLNSLFNFSISTPPIDISTASFSINGYQVYNDNITYPLITASLYNFSGSNYVQFFNTSSCLSQSVSVFPFQTMNFETVIVYDVSGVGPSRLENIKINKISENRFNDTLSPYKSTANKNSENYYSDTNILGIFLAPTDERNTDMLNFYGNTNIISSVACPDDRWTSTSRYTSYQTLRNNFYNYANKYKVLFNELFTIYNIYVDKSIFDTLTNILPSRNKIYTGLLIEPTILERSKIPNLPPFVENISVLSDNIVFKPKSSANFINLLSDNIITRKYPYDNSYVENTYTGFSNIKDVPDDYQLGVFVDSLSGITQYNGIQYFTYLVNYTAENGYTDGINLTDVSSRIFTKIDLVPTGSVFNAPAPANYAFYKYNYYHSLVHKLIPFRKKSFANFSTTITYAEAPSWFVKSRETNTTTINDLGTTNRSPIISTTVGGVVNTSQIGTSGNNVGINTTGLGGSSVVVNAGVAGTGGTTP